jgi:hypothetical protein
MLRPEEVSRDQNESGEYPAAGVLPVVRMLSHGVPLYFAGSM